MNPADVPARDYNLYYNRTYMLHDEAGPVSVRPDGGHLLLYPLLDPRNSIRAKTKGDKRKLQVWWPRSGAYNTMNGNAVHISRKASRCMRKSASDNHYTMKWGKVPMDQNMFHILARGPNYMSWDVAKAMLYNKACRSVAVARDLIFTDDDKEGYGVIFRGNPVGRFKDGEYYPDVDLAPSTKLVWARLEKEGII